MLKRSNLPANNLIKCNNKIEDFKGKQLHSQQCKVHNSHRPIKITDMQKTVKHDL